MKRGKGYGKRCVCVYHVKARPSADSRKVASNDSTKYQLLAAQGPDKTLRHRVVTSMIINSGDLGVSGARTLTGACQHRDFVSRPGLRFQQVLGTDRIPIRLGQRMIHYMYDAHEEYLPAMRFNAQGRFLARQRGALLSNHPQLHSLCSAMILLPASAVPEPKGQSPMDQFNSDAPMRIPPSMTVRPG